MIKTIVTQIKNHLVAETGGVSWAERVAGLAIQAERPIMDTFEGRQVKLGSEFYPITDDLEGKACYENGRYYDLLPSSAYKSVIYFEQTAPLLYQGSKDIKGKIWVFEGNIRLVCWLNLKKFGEENHGLSDRAMLTIIKRLRANKGQGVGTGSIPVNDDNYTDARLDVTIIGSPITDRLIFGRYTIAQIAENLLYPFEFFAIDMKVRFEVGKECVSEILEADPVC
jgi:hypothetical protein